MKRIITVLLILMVSHTVTAQNQHLSKINNSINQYLKELTGNTVLFESLKIKSASVGKVPYAMMDDLVSIYPNKDGDEINFTPVEYNVEYELSFGKNRNFELIFTLDSTLNISQGTSTSKEVILICGKILSKELITIDKAIEICSNKFGDYTNWKFITISSKAKDFTNEPYKKGEVVTSCTIKGICENCEYNSIRLQVDLKNGVIISKYQSKQID